MVLQLKCCIVDLNRREVARDGATLTLSEHEAGLLAYLSQRAGQSVSRKELLEEVWGWRARGVTRAVDNTVMRLRTKIERPGEPEHLVTVRGVGYRFEGPAPEAPAVSRLLGRDDTLALLLARLRGGGLHTLLGPGGVGKTALAQAALQQRRGMFCDLSSARTPDAAAAMVAARLGATGSDPAAAVAGHLAAQSGLLVLDNIEQLVDDGWELLQRWARSARPDLAILATSRVRIGIPEEQPLVIEPLAADDAVALLQARSQRPPAPPSDDERRLVALVDCLPLAVELLAGWAALATPGQLCDQLQGRLTALQSRDRRTARHRSLQAVFDGSWALLDDEEARTLRRLSVFFRPFTLEGASAVCGRPVLQALGRLVDRSMLQQHRDDEGHTRFRMLSLVAADAARRLAADPAEQDDARLQHARWFAAQVVAQEARKNSDRGGYNRWMIRSRSDLLAIAGRLQETRPALAAEAICGLGVLALSSGSDPAEELARVRTVSDRLPPSELWVRLVQLEASWLMRLHRADECAALIEDVLPTAWEIAPDRAAFMVCTAAFQQILIGQGAAATARLEEALPQLPEEMPTRSLMLGYLGLTWYARGDLRRAEPLLREAVARLDRIRNYVGRDWFAEKHALCLGRLGELDGAVETLSHLLQRAEDAQMRGTAAGLARHLGVLHLGRRAFGEAERCLWYAIELGDKRPYTDAIVSYTGLGDIAALQGDRSAARERWRQSRVLTEQVAQEGEGRLLEAREALLDGRPQQIQPTTPDDLIYPELQALRTGDARGDPDPGVQICALLHRTLLAPKDPQEG